MTAAVSLGELLHEEALFGLTGVRKGGSTQRTLIPVWTLPLRHISSSLGVARPFTNGVEWGWKKCTDPMVGGARSITRKETITRKMAPITRRVNSFLVYFVCTLRGWRFQKLNRKEEEEETKKNRPINLLHSYNILHKLQVLHLTLTFIIQNKYLSTLFIYINIYYESF